MRKLLAGAFALALTACATTPNLVTQKSVYELRLAYNAAVLQPAAAYRSLGDCPGTTKFTVERPCAERAIIVKLQRLDRTFQSAVLAADAAAANNAFEAARTVIATLQGWR